MERFAYVQRESGVMQAVLTLGFFLGVFSIAPFRAWRVGPLVIGILNGMAIVTAAVIASVPSWTNGGIIMLLLFAFAVPIGGILPIAGNLIDETHTANGRHIVTGLLAMNIAAGVLGLGGGGIMSLLDGKGIEMQFGLPVGLPSGFALLCSFAAVFALPKPSSAVESHLA
jgi:hypothetical protein